VKEFEEVGGGMVLWRVEIGVCVVQESLGIQDLSDAGERQRFHMLFWPAQK
jgi:hypothetical protein